MQDLKSPEKKFRPEIEGVRAVAAMLVAIYHIWIGSVSGGVDVFFIVSGYLITTSLLSKIERSGRLQIGEYLLGLGRRLLPLALTVTFVTTVASFFLLPEVQWGQTVSQVFSSMFYYQNWQLAINSVDYLAQNNVASPFQHFWALSLQGQFYITWPIIILLAFFLATKLFKTPLRKTLLSVLITLFIASLSYSIYITAVNQPWAYFSSFARVWEFSIGGMLALLLPYLSFNKITSLMASWLGLATVCLTGIILPVSSVFPGYAALLPITGVILIIISAENASSYGAQKLLGSRPLMYFGSISYAFYLWHWPMLIFYYNYFDVSDVPFLHGLFIIVAAFILSVVTSNVLESPVRNLNVRTQKRRLATILVTFLIPAVIVGVAWNQYITEAQASNLENISVEGGPEPSADVFDTSLEDVQPSMIEVSSDLPVLYDDDSCYSSTTDPEVNICSMGETENPDYTVALVGGSHSGHWYPAVEEAAKELNLQIDLYLKDACRYSTEDFDGKLSESCMEWNDNVDEPLIESNPDLVITTATVAGDLSIPDGYIEKWEKLEGEMPILALRDHPRMPEDVPTCLEENGIEECTIDREEILRDGIPWEDEENLPDHVYFADFTEYLCDDNNCYPVVDRMITYRDKHHLTAVYARSLGGPLTEEINRILQQID
ncbi:peptidoglycan/LPS O-acetylase OafA/YrhL [Alkalibacillus flavidus]|uniref:Peptidoglycan/LPS O-acetylase OafA/YrhL n=1 Tax=Alkalibacillus flavidus TaxID=546021 RepID=A0ABV2KTZ6_9BACI